MIYILTEHLTFFWFAIFEYECKPEFQFKQEFEQCLYLVFLYFIFSSQLIRHCQ